MNQAFISLKIITRYSLHFRNYFIHRSIYLNGSILKPKSLLLLSSFYYSLPPSYEVMKRPPLNLIQKREMKLWNEKLMRKMYWRKRSFDAVPEKLRARSEWQQWDYSSEIFAFAQRLHEPQLDSQTLTQAFTHQSYVIQQQAKRKELGVQDVQEHLYDNGEMIQSGRSLMKQFLPKYLRYHLRMAPEECIQSLVQHLMSIAVLNDISKWIGCIDLVLCVELPPNEETLSNTVFALVGAIEQTGGQKRAENFIIDFILTYLNGVDLLEIWPIDQMDLNLNAFLKSKGSPSAEPRLLYQSAIGTLESCYVVGIYVGHKLMGQSGGESIQIAKRMAELDTFRQFFGLTTSLVRFKYGPKAYSLNFEQFENENFRLFKSSTVAEQVHQKL